MVRRYKVFFKFKGEMYTTLLPENKGIGDILDGMWIDEDFEYSIFSKNKYWIPISKIETVEIVHI